MKGASASRASRRAISVLPTPVGPIIRMFFGVISCRSGSATCWRRQRLRSAIATARFALPCPTMYLSSSWTISCGVMPLMRQPPKKGSEQFSGNTCYRKIALTPFLFEHFDRALVIGIDAKIRRDRERLLDDLARTELGVLQEG